MEFPNNDTRPAPVASDEVISPSILRELRGPKVDLRSYSRCDIGYSGYDTAVPGWVYDAPSIGGPWVIEESDDRFSVPYCQHWFLVDSIEEAELALVFVAFSLGGVTPSLSHSEMAALEQILTPLDAHCVNELREHNRHPDAPTSRPGDK